MLTFKATITSDLTMPKDANFDIAGQFALEHPNSQRVDYISLSEEQFEFTKTRIVFSPTQIERFADNLFLDPFYHTCKLVDNTHYSLITTIINDNNIYKIEIGDTKNKCQATLHLDWFNLLRFRIVHYNTLKYPTITWLDILKFVGWLILAVFAFIQAFNGCNENKSLSTNPPSSIDTLNKKIQEKRGSLKDTIDSFHTDTFHSFPYFKDTTKTN